MVSVLRLRTRGTHQIRISLDLIGKRPNEEYIVYDLLTREYNPMKLNPNLMPMHLFRIEDLQRRFLSELGFVGFGDYFV